MLRRIAELETENAKLRERLARAKNPEPVQRPSFERVKRLASNACMEVSRHKNGGFVLSFGRLQRWFKRLRDLWEIFTSDDWKLSEIFSKKILPPIQRRSRVQQRNPSLAPALNTITPQWWHGNRIPFSWEVLAYGTLSPTGFKVELNFGGMLPIFLQSPLSSSQFL